VIVLLISLHVADEGACILVECSSTDPTVEKEVRSNVMKTITEGRLLPDDGDDTTSVFPKVIVVSY
jgi:hypothetical protein